MGGCHLITMGRLFIPFLLFFCFFYLPLLFNCRALSGVDLNVCSPPIFRASSRTNKLVCMNGRFDAACLNVHLYLRARTGHVRPLCLQRRRLACSAFKLPVFLCPLAHYTCRHITFHPPNKHYSTDGPLHIRTPTLIIFPPAPSCAPSLVIHVIVTSTYTGPLYDLLHRPPTWTLTDSQYIILHRFIQLSTNYSTRPTIICLLHLQNALVIAHTHVRAGWAAPPIPIAMRCAARPPAPVPLA